MSEIDKVLNDPNVINYNGNSKFQTYYTCFPKTLQSYDCLNGVFDTSYSEFDYFTSTWKVYSVPKIIPKKFHTSYIQYISRNNINIVE
jgi:hypothetical protein